MQKDSAIISVVTAHYNMSNRIVEAINSVEIQGESVLEHIIIDDNSNPIEYDRLVQIVQNRKKIKLFRNDSNIGPLKSANKGSTIAKGKLIIFLSADDRLASNLCESIVKPYFIYENCGMFFGDLIVTFPNKKLTYRKKIVQSDRSIYIDIKSELIMNGFRDPLHGGAALNLQIFRDLGLYKTELMWNADTILHWEILIKHGAFYLPIPHLIFEKNSSSFGSKTFLYNPEKIEVYDQLFAHIETCKPEIGFILKKNGSLGKHPNVIRYLVSKKKIFKYLNMKFLLVFIFFETARAVRRTILNFSK